MYSSPSNREEEFFAQLTAEKLETVREKSKVKQQFILTRPRNEALDCRVGALAAYYLLDPDFEEIKKNLLIYSNPEPPKPKNTPQKRHQRQQQQRLIR